MGKTFLLAITILATIIVTPSLALAQTTESAKTNQKANQQNQKVATLKTKAENEINRRLVSLNKLTQKIISIKKLSAAQKASLNSQIQSEITALTSLKTKINGDVDVATLKEDVKAIVTSYRIYLLYIPKIHLLAAADIMSETAEKLASLSAKLEIRIQQAQAIGKEIVSTQATLSDMQNKITEAGQQYQKIESAVLPLAPAGYPGNKTILQSARVLLQIGHQDLQAAWKDAQKISQDLKLLKNKASSTLPILPATPTAGSTASSTTQ
ncbi:MAG: hypothetical protein M1150_01060 [Patescibacteria group bacterium]|nr:hypothetical protein [Patescibacteria group bacterium]